MPFIMERNVQLMMMLVLQHLRFLSVKVHHALCVIFRMTTYVTVFSIVPKARASLGISSVPIQAMVATPVE